ncbi:MAG: NAD-dependent epimerase/dehydratase family protein [Candidatus Eremiobacteraeota bacterium]|nr:NAD-dependent epimerase/dehydratase family protein [Candidatus Eremiobacteraeota bacterium]
MSRLAFVTGGTGFVGANLIRALLAAGWSVRALARPHSDKRNLDGLPIEVVPGDVNAPDLATSMRGADAVFHVAAHYSLWRRDKDALLHSNVDGTRNVLAAARNADVPRTVYTSSVAAIGVKSGGIADESYQSPPERLIGAYKQSKFLAEREARAAAAAGQDVVIASPTTPIGPWDRKPTPTGDIFVRFLTGRMPFIVETGLNWVAVEDVARGHLLAYEHGRSGERYILGGENFTLRELLRRIGEIAGRRPPRYAVPLWLPLGVAWLGETVFPRFGFEPKIPIDGVRMSKESMYYDTSKARDQLGYVPGPLDPAIREAIQWFADNGYLKRRR